jgi:hypothetical protein
MIKFEKLFYIMDKNIFPARPFYGRVEKENCQRIREKKIVNSKFFLGDASNFICISVQVCTTFALYREVEIEAC